MPRPLRLTLLAGLMALVPTLAWAGLCTPNASTLCLQGDRFQVTVDWTSGPDSGAGLVMPIATDNFGFFRYLDSEAAEVLARVVDGCAFNGNFWVQLGILSDFGQTITVTDLSLGTQQQYVYTEGTYGQPTIDLGGFPCTAPFDPEPPSRAATEGLELLLIDGRFRVEVSWTDQGGGTGSGQPTTIADRSGYFGFIVSGNPDMAVKMTGGAGSDFHTFVASAVSTLAYELTVTDLCSGDVQVYNQPINNSLTIADEEAFLVECPLIFQDGFESGDVLAWTSVVGGP